MGHEHVHNAHGADHSHDTYPDHTHEPPVRDESVKAEQPTPARKPVPIVPETPLGPPRFVTQLGEPFTVGACPACRQTGIENNAAFFATTTVAPSKCSKCDGYGIIGVPLKNVRVYRHEDSISARA